MTRMITRSTAAFLLFSFGCSSDTERPESIPVDCSVLDRYEFRNIFDFNGMDPQWFRYADPTPGGHPQPDIDGSDVDPPVPNDPPRCGDPQSLKLEAWGHNFWGAGFGSWGLTDPGNRADGTVLGGFEGISFWARSAPNSEKNFIFNVDDPRTMVNAPDPAEQGVCKETVNGAVATDADQDLDGDGCIGPGDIVFGTECRLPPPEELGAVECYKGGINEPSSAGTRVPAPDECGNQFHTLIETTEHWQLFLMPWDQLVQWPCPNRLAGGIDRSQISGFQIALQQGTRYEFWIDNIAFYRKR